jgi:hypothetical protein
MHASSLIVQLASNLATIETWCTLFDFSRSLYLA